ncbi:hypothetical protein INT47_006950 [Mucor saturninus]|uniref:SWIM-type domain-containing protein n=1 Tax=Mucor saturninus TaxID=64648 RepID=A0A8H7UYQ7_9FUNG|nr:hypothetical protein INT47_006950 [Mucor saturninus]
MMWERDRPVFTRQLTVFITENSVSWPFCSILKSRYLENDAFMRWSAAYQPAMYTNLETNNYVESWHNQLKAIYLEMQAKAISGDALEQIIETASTNSDGRSVYVVSSFSTSGVNYNVVVDDFQMNSCRSPDFRFNNIACKHMY